MNRHNQSGFSAGNNNRNLNINEFKTPEILNKETPGQNENSEQENDMGTWNTALHREHRLEESSILSKEDIEKNSRQKRTQIQTDTEFGFTKFIEENPNTAIIGGVCVLGLAAYLGYRITNKVKQEAEKELKRQTEKAEKASQAVQSKTTKIKQKTTAKTAEIKTAAAQKKEEAETTVKTTAKKAAEHINLKTTAKKRLVGQAVKIATGSSILGAAIGYANNPETVIAWGKQVLNLDLRGIKIGGKTFLETIQESAKKIKEGKSPLPEFEKVGKTIENLTNCQKLAGRVGLENGLELFPLMEADFPLKLLFTCLDHENQILKLPPSLLDPTYEIQIPIEAKRQQYLLIKHLFDLKDSDLRKKWSIAKQKMEEQGAEGLPENPDELPLTIAIELLTGDFTKRPYYAQQAMLHSKTNRFRGLKPIDIHLGNLFTINLFQGTGTNRTDYNLDQSIAAKREEIRKNFEENFVKKAVAKDPELKMLSDSIEGYQKDLETKTKELESIDENIKNLEAERQKLQKKRNLLPSEQTRLQNIPAEIDNFKTQAQKTSSQIEMLGRGMHHTKQTFDAQLAKTDPANYKKYREKYHQQMLKAGTEFLTEKNKIIARCETELQELQNNKTTLENKLKNLNPNSPEYKLKQNEIASLEIKFDTQRRTYHQELISLDQSFSKFKFEPSLADLEDHFAQKKDYYEKHMQRANTSWQKGLIQTGTLLGLDMPENWNDRAWAPLEAMGYKNPRQQFKEYLVVEQTLKKNQGTIKKLTKKGLEKTNTARKWGKGGMMAGSFINTAMHEPQNFKWDAAEMTAGFVPIAGTVMDLKQAITGHDLTGRELRKWERVTAGAFAGIGAVADLTTLIGVGVGIRAGLTALRGVKNAAKISKSAKAYKTAKAVLLKGDKEGQEIYQSYAAANSAIRSQSLLGKSSYWLNKGGQLTGHGMMACSTYGMVQPYIGNVSAWDLAKKGYQGAKWGTEKTIKAMGYSSKVYDKMMVEAEKAEQWRENNIGYYIKPEDLMLTDDESRRKFLAQNAFTNFYQTHTAEHNPALIPAIEHQIQQEARVEYS